MNCIRTICLYLKDYISDDQFEDIFYKYIDDFQNSLDEKIYLNVLSTSFSSKEEKISLKTELRTYILNNRQLFYENINDAYVERIIDLDKEDIVVDLLGEKYKKKEKVNIDCSTIKTKAEMIAAVKKALQYPQFCGDNWNAVEDLIFDIILPEKIIFSNWFELEKKLPEDAIILRDILQRYSNGRCTVIYS